MNLVDKYGHARCDDYISVNDESETHWLFI